MRYEREINIKLDHSCRPQDIRTIETTLRLVIDYEVRETPKGYRYVDVGRTQQRVGLGRLFEAEWWWDFCPHGMRGLLDSEMMSKWLNEQAVTEEAGRNLDTLVEIR